MQITGELSDHFESVSCSRLSDALKRLVLDLIENLL